MFCSKSAFCARIFVDYSFGPCRGFGPRAPDCPRSDLVRHRFGLDLAFFGTAFYVLVELPGSQLRLVSGSGASGRGSEATGFGPGLAGAGC